MITKITIMRPDQAHDGREFDLPREPGYHKLREILTPLLDGAELEHVSVFADFAGGTNYKRADMFVDDRGLLKNLPRNEAATLIYRRANQMGRSSAPPLADPEQLSFICGPAILFNRIVWF
jgi:hypothetical protein